MCKNLQHSLTVLTLMLFLAGCSVAKAPDYNGERNAQNLVDRGILFLESGKLVEAESSFWMALETSPIASAYDGLGCVALLRGQYIEAEKLFRKLIEVFPDYVDARLNLAIVLEATGRKNEAVSQYRTALMRNPLNLKARNNLGALLVGMGGERNKGHGKQFLIDSEVLSPNRLAKMNLDALEMGKH